MIRLLVDTYGADTSLLNREGAGAATLLLRKGLFELAEKVTRKGLADAMEHSDPEAQCSSLMRVLQDSSGNPEYGSEMPDTDYASRQNDAGWAPLHFCANAGEVHAIRELLRVYGADVNVLENDRWSPLMFAV